MRSDAYYEWDDFIFGLTKSEIQEVEAIGDKLDEYLNAGNHAVAYLLNT